MNPLKRFLPVQCDPFKDNMMKVGDVGVPAFTYTLTYTDQLAVFAAWAIRHAAKLRNGVKEYRDA